MKKQRPPRGALFFRGFFPPKRLTNPPRAYNINSVRSLTGRALSHKAVNRTSNRNASSQRAARMVRGRRGGPGEDHLRAADRTCAFRAAVGSAGAPVTAQMSAALSRSACLQRGSKSSDCANCPAPPLAASANSLRLVLARCSQRLSASCGIGVVPQRVAPLSPFGGRAFLFCGRGGKGPRSAAGALRRRFLSTEGPDGSPRQGPFSQTLCTPG